MCRVVEVLEQMPGTTPYCRIVLLHHLLDLLVLGLRAELLRSVRVPTFGSGHNSNSMPRNTQSLRNVRDRVQNLVVDKFLVKKMQPSS